MSAGSGRFHFGTSVITKFFVFSSCSFIAQSLSVWQAEISLALCTSKQHPFYGHIFINKEIFVSRCLENVQPKSNKTEHCLHCKSGLPSLPRAALCLSHILTVLCQKQIRYWKMNCCSSIYLKRKQINILAVWEILLWNFWMSCSHTIHVTFLNCCDGTFHSNANTPVHL